MRQREKIMILQSKRVWVLNQWMEAQIEVCRESGKIEAILPYGSAPADMDFGELRVVPGFIDVHTHGAYGFDTNDAEEEGLRNWVQNIVGEGVTGFLPTTITQSSGQRSGSGDTGHTFGRALSQSEV